VIHGDNAANVLALTPKRKVAGWIQPRHHAFAITEVLSALFPFKRSQVNESVVSSMRSLLAQFELSVTLKPTEDKLEC